MNTLANSIENAEKKEPGLLPDLRNTDTVFVLSDFGGGHKEARYLALSFLFVDPGTFYRWDRLWQPERHRHLADGRRMAYKKLNDRRRKAALGPFLSAADELNGLLVCFLIHKGIESLFERQGRMEISESEQMEFGEWKPAVFEKLLLSVHIVSLFLAGLSKPNQDILWYTDKDEIAPNIYKLYNVCEIFNRISSQYLPHQMRHFRFGTSASDDGTKRLEDLLSIPDLSAGCMQDLLSCYEEANMELQTKLILPAPPHLSWKARTLIEWFSTQGAALKRFVYSINPIKDSKSIRIQRIKFWSTGLVCDKRAYPHNPSVHRTAKT